MYCGSIISECGAFLCYSNCSSLNVCTNNKHTSTSCGDANAYTLKPYAFSCNLDPYNTRTDKSTIDDKAYNDQSNGVAANANISSSWLIKRYPSTLLFLEWGFLRTTK